ncbi:MAG: DNA-3-methyladenine glycosylase I [Bacteroidetes bacterium]|nr:DNA-3-methyladenine glycosylase I [Bacteroidota bacterium]
MATYCEAIALMKEGDHEYHKKYHDEKYGFPIQDDNELFCRLVLEINQAGLSWTTILKKEKNFRKAYNNFNIVKVAAYGEKEVERLLNDPGIIRNRLKIAAAIYNAGVIKEIKKEHGSFLNWLHKNHPLSRNEWTSLFKRTFRFTGGEIVNEFLVSTGFLPGAHHTNCKIYKSVLKSKPAWNN